jgi:site-specific DNA recombinase
MKDINQFQDFAKKSKKLVFDVHGKGVIYTRVSTKEQADNNASLETQLMKCQNFAKQKGIDVVEYFGGTYESAKSDERKEFQKMIKYVKQRNDIAYIIVYAFDRFSRTGIEAAYLSNELKKLGIATISASQDIDANSTHGDLVKNLMLFLAEMDNQNRREKSVTGMQEKLRKGHWIGTIPFGYTNLNPGKGKEPKIVVNNQGKLLKYAFQWKVRENITNNEIGERLEKKGLTINPKKLSDYFRNPFYCGIITSSHIPGEIINGKQEKLISHDLFLKVQEALNKRGYGEKLNKNAEELPLKQFVKSSNCKTALTGYLAKKKNLWYYKTNRTGAKENKSAKVMHQQFSKLLSGFQIEEEKYLAPTKSMLLNAFKLANEEATQESDVQKSKLKELKTKLDRLEERFVFEEINRDQYEKFKLKLDEDVDRIEKIIAENDFDLSNLEKGLDIALNYSLKLPSLWEDGNLKTKKSIQNMLFPDGILYDFKNSDYRTFRTNSVFSAISSLSESFGHKKSGNNAVLPDCSRLVP